MEGFLGLGNYHIRITKKVSIDDIQKFMRQLGNKYIIGFEENHFHIHLNTQKNKKEITVVLKQGLGLKGNENFSVVLARNNTQLKKYILKDGEFTYKGYLDSEIDALYQASNKKGKDKFQRDLIDLEDRYFNSEIIYRKFCEDFVLLKIDYGQNLYGNHIRAYLDKVCIKKDRNNVSNYVDNLGLSAFKY